MKNFTRKNSRMARGPVKGIAETALLALLIYGSGLLRVPGLLPGSEFQLSAPIAVAVCGVFGFKTYILAGLTASLLGALLGTANAFQLLIAMCFRLSVGAVWLLCGSSRFFYLCAGPAGTAFARYALSLVLGQGFFPLLAAAIPGMLYTAASAWFFGKLLARCKRK